MKVCTLVFDYMETLPMKATAVLIQKASVYKSSVWLTCGERRANAKSLLGVMSLDISQGATIEVVTEGPDEEEALEDISNYLKSPTI